MTTFNQDTITSYVAMKREIVRIGECKHWLDWQRDHENWTWLWWLDILEGNPNPAWWCDQPESVSGWTCKFGNRG